MATEHGKHGRNYYLSDIPLDEATQAFHARLEAVGALGASESEVVALDRAVGRITAEPIWAVRSSPHYDAAAMDGVAVRARDTVGAMETAPLRLKLGEQAAWVDTGDPLPPGFDAVIMVEVVHEVDESTIEIQASVPPYQHVRALGEDIVASELILPESHKLRPQDLAACAASGLTWIPVRKPPIVTIIPTGTELVPLGTDPKPGDIIEFNSLMLGAMVDGWGGSAIRANPVPDDYERIKSAVRLGIETSDIVIVNAGSSAGSEDYTARMVEDLGELVVHGVALKPGHPVVLGVVDNKPVVGIPGYPVSAAVTSEIFVKPLIERMLGVPGEARQMISANIARKVLSSIGEDEILRVKVGRVGEKMVATPIQRGAGVVMSLVRADGLVRIPRFSEGLAEGEQVTVDLLRSIESLEGTIVATGSHDPALDLLASELRRSRPELTLASTNVGSLGGLLAINRGEAHMAGCHLLDEETGEYNVKHVTRYVRGKNVVLVNLVHRVQGFIVAKGNPSSIASLDDLTRSGVKFVNRQRGSGTRMLFDYLLKQHVIQAEQIPGYEREEFTHLAVAAAVAGGRADVGLGVLSAARALGMDFIPLRNEQYDLVMSVDAYESDHMRALLSVIRDPEFKQKVDALGGYDVSSMGEVVAELA